MYVGIYVVAFEINRQRALIKKCKSTNTLSTKCGKTARRYAKLDMKNVKKKMFCSK